MAKDLMVIHEATPAWPGMMARMPSGPAAGVDDPERERERARESNRKRTEGDHGVGHDPPRSEDHRRSTEKRRVECLEQWRTLNHAGIAHYSRQGRCCMVVSFFCSVFLDFPERCVPISKTTIIHMHGIERHEQIVGWTSIGV